MLHARWCVVDLDAGRVEPDGRAPDRGKHRVARSSRAGRLDVEPAVFVGEPARDASAQATVDAAAELASGAEPAAGWFGSGQACAPACSTQAAAGAPVGRRASGARSGPGSGQARAGARAATRTRRAGPDAAELAAFADATPRRHGAGG